MSRSRLLSSYGSITAMLALAIWIAVGSLPLVGRPQIIADVRSDPAPAAQPQLIAEELKPLPAPLQPRQGTPQAGGVRGPSEAVPPDVHELATGSIQPAVSAADRASAFALLDRAVQNGKMHIRTISSYEMKVTFLAGGSAQYTGSGEMTESWASAQSWRWTANLGGFSISRIGSHGLTADAQPVSMVPMRIQMLRDAIFWAERSPRPNAMIRTAAAQLDGKPVTCILSSNMPPSETATRLWEEEERCIGNDSGLMEVLSVAPGTYVIYGYSRNRQFHGRTIPDQIAAYVNGSVALDAQMTLSDLGSVDASVFTITPEMSEAGLALSVTQRFPLNVGDVSGVAKPVIVHATIGEDGRVIEEELSAASDPALAQSALDLVKKTSFAGVRATQRDEYINVRFGN